MERGGNEKCWHSQVKLVVAQSKQFFPPIACPLRNFRRRYCDRNLRESFETDDGLTDLYVKIYSTIVPHLARRWAIGALPASGPLESKSVRQISCTVHCALGATCAHTHTHPHACPGPVLQAQAS